MDEVKGLRNVLELFVDVAKEAEATQSSSLETLQMLCDPQKGSLSLTLVELQGLAKKLDSPRQRKYLGEKSRALVQVIAWQFKDGDVKEVLERLERFKSTLTLAISTDHTLALPVARSALVMVSD